MMLSKIGFAGIVKKIICVKAIKYYSENHLLDDE